MNAILYYITFADQDNYWPITKTEVTVYWLEEYVNYTTISAKKAAGYEQSFKDNIYIWAPMNLLNL